MLAAKRLLLITAACVLAKADDQPLRMWLVLNEPADKSVASELQLDQFLKKWRTQGIDLFANRGRAVQDPDYAALLAGQLSVLGSVADFRRRQNGFPVVELRFFTWDEYFDKLTKSATGVSGPDLVQVPSTWCISLAREFKILAPIQRDLLNRFPGQISQACQPEGKSQFFGIPWTVDVRLLFFWRRDFPALDRDLEQQHDRRAVFERALISAEKHLGRPPFALPTARDWELLHQTSLLVWAYNGELLEADRELLFFPSHRATFTEPALNGALFLKSLLNRKLLDLPRINRDQLEQTFLDHKYGSMISGPWMLAKLAKQIGSGLESEIGVALPPFGGAASATFVGGSFLGSTQKSPESMKPHATALAMHLATGAQAANFARRTGLIPADNDARGASTLGAANISEATFYGYLRSIASTDRFSKIITTAIDNGRPYPRISKWWLLEAPAQIGGLYRFWQDIADAQPDNELQTDLNTIASEWNTSLRYFPWWVSWALSLAVIALALGSWALRSIGTRDRNLSGIAADLASVNVTLDSVVGELQDAKKDSETARVEHQEMIADKDATIAKKDATIQEFEDWAISLQKELVDKMSQARPEGHPPPAAPTVDRPLEVLIRGTNLELRFNGKTAKLIRRDAQVFSHLIRTCLLNHAPVQYSGILGLSLFWQNIDKRPETGVRARWEAIVSAMRTALKRIDLHPTDGTSGVKIGLGDRGIYEFSVDELHCRLLLATDCAEVPFVECVRAQINESNIRLASGDVIEAFAHAQRAMNSEWNLPSMDLSLLILLVQVYSRIPSGQISSEQRKPYEHARRQLTQHLETLSLMLENYPRDRLLELIDLRNIPDSGTRALFGQLDRLDETKRSIESALGVAPTPIEWPITIKDYCDLWRNRERLRTVYEQGEWEEKTQEAFLEIIRYFNVTAANAIFSEVVAVLVRLDSNKAHDRRSRLLEINAENVASLLDQDSPDGSKAVTMVGHLSWMLKESLCCELHQCVVTPGRSSVLLDCAGVGSRETASRVRDGVRNGIQTNQWPSTFELIVERLIAVRQSRGASGATAGGLL